MASIQDPAAAHAANAANGNSDLSATSKKAKKKNKKATATAENVTSASTAMNDDIPVPQLGDSATASTSENIATSASAAETAEKSKKRKRKDGDANNAEENASEENGQGNTADDFNVVSQEKKKKKKKKDKNGTTEAAATEGEVATATVRNGGAERDVDASAAKPSKKKKKSKKDKAVDGQAVTGDSTMEVDNPEQQQAEGEGEANNQKKKKKDKEGAPADGSEATNAEKQQKKKKEKKSKDATTTQIPAAAAAPTIPSTSGSTAQASRARQESSPLPNLPMPLPPMPPTFSASALEAAASASDANDYDNIDPALWPAARAVSNTGSSAAVPTAPSNRSVSVAGSTSFLPRDPSIAPGDGLLASIQEKLSHASTTATSGKEKPPPKKRGRPRKDAATADTSSAVPAIVPALAAGSTSSASGPLANGSSRPVTTISASTIAPGRIMPSPIAPGSQAPVGPSPVASTSTAVALPSAATGRGGTGQPIVVPGMSAITAARAAMNNPNFVPNTLPEGVPTLLPSQNKEVHQELLAARWLSAKDIAELTATEGLKVRTGKFSKAEDAALRLCIENYRLQQGLTEQQIKDIINANGRNVRSDFGDFWTIVTRSTPDRPMMSVYHHVKRLMQEEARKGPWTPEEDAKLKASFKLHGPAWKKVAADVGTRWDQDCRDRWRVYLRPNETVNKGLWSKDEEDLLRDVVKQVKAEITKYREDNGGGTLEGEPVGGSDMFWTRVAAKMGTRSKSQCRIKWNDNMRNKLLTKDGKPVRWDKRDTFILIMKLDSLQRQDEEEIAWTYLPDSHWNWWSPHILQKRWSNMKIRARNALKKPNATYPEIIAYLKAEQDKIPRKIVKAFMSKRIGLADPIGDADVDAEAEDDVQMDGEDNDEDEDDDDDDDDGNEGAAGTSGKVSKKQYRTNEFVNSSDEED